MLIEVAFTANFTRTMEIDDRFAPVIEQIENNRHFIGEMDELNSEFFEEEIEAKEIELANDGYDWPKIWQINGVEID